MKKTVCVTGGSGGIGQALLERLLGLYRVKALFRTKNSSTENWEQRGCIPVWGDLEHEAALAELVEGAEFVFHCAAIVAQASYEKAHAVNVEGTQRLAALAAARGCKRFVHVSSAAVYSGTSIETDHTEGIELAEHADMAVYALTKLMSERVLQNVAKEQNLDYCILRPTWVYGPHTKSFTEIPIAMIRKGLPVVLGNGAGLMDAVYVDDVVDALLQAATSPNASGEIFNIGHETVTLKDFYSRYGLMVNKPVRQIPIARLHSVATRLARVPGLKPRLDAVRRGIGFLLKSSENRRAYPSTKASALLGYAPRVTLPIGMLKIELWAKRQELMPQAPSFVKCYGVLPFRPQATVRPTVEQELVDIMRMAIANHIPVKAIGSLHSLSPIPETEGICIVLEDYRKLLKVEGSLVTVQAGMTIKELNHALVEWNLALPIMGSISAQTVAGAISTATHGGSTYFGSLSDYVEALRIVKADASIVEIDRSHEAFPAIAACMGLFGLILSVTLRCVPAFQLQSQGSVLPVEEALDKFDEIHRENVYVDMLYFPITDQIEMLRVNRPEPGKESTADADQETDAAKAAVNRNGKVSYLLRIAILKALAWTLRRGKPIQRYMTRFSVGSSHSSRSGRSDRVLAFSDLGSSGRSPGILRDMEVAIPIEHARTAIGKLRDHFNTTGTYPLLPIHIRCSPPSELWLSPAYRREVL